MHGRGTSARALDELTPEQRKEFLQMVVEEVIIDRNDNVNITLAIPVDSKPTTGVFVQTFENVQTLEPSRCGSCWKYNRAVVLTAPVKLNSK